MDAPGFSDASVSVSANDVLFLANEHAQRIMNSIFTKRYSRYASFISRFADWTVFDMEKKERMYGAAVYEKSASYFMHVLEASQPSVSSLSSVLPSYTKAHGRRQRTRKAGTCKI